MNAAATTDDGFAPWHLPIRAVPEGSDAYYAARFAPATSRDRLVLAFTWDYELRQIEAKASDPGVARLKLDWWRDELVRAHGGRPRHPLTRQLAPWLATWLELTPWLAMIDGAETRIRKLQPATTEEFHEQCQRLGGSLGWLTASVDGRPTPSQIALARRFTAYREAVHCVRDLARHVQHQFCPLPREALAAAGLPSHGLQLDANVPALAHCLDGVLGSPDWVFREARHARTAPHDEVAPSARLAIQAALLHRKIANRNFPVLRDYVELTPLRRLWAAWRLG